MCFCFSDIDTLNTVICRSVFDSVKTVGLSGLKQHDFVSIIMDIKTKLSTYAFI